MQVVANSIRNARQPLTLDQIRTVAPSAFAERPWDAVSARYAFVPTSAVIERMIQNGFQPYAVTQSRSRIEGKREFTKHMIRFRSPNVNVTKVGDVFPEIVMINSHDRTSSYQLMAGLFRLVCSNGAVVDDGAVQRISVQHTGNIVEEVLRGSIEIVDHMPKVIDAVARWQQHQLSAAEQQIFAEEALAYRFSDSEGNVKTAIKPQQLLASRRYADDKNDLWSVFNRVQENVIRGGVDAGRDPETQRRRVSRAVKGIDQDVKLNRALWSLSEKMAALKGA
jgi:hypothetical protein